MNPDLTIAPNSVFDLTQPVNGNPDTNGFTLASLGNLNTWLNTAISGAGTVLGTLNNKPATTPAPAPAASQSIPSWLWIGGAAAMVLFALFLFLTPKK